MATNPLQDWDYFVFKIESDDGPPRLVAVYTPDPDTAAQSVGALKDETVTPVVMGEFETALRIRFTRKRPKQSEMVGFYNELYKCISLKTPGIRAMRLIMSQAETPIMRGILSGMASRLADGKSYSAAMAAYPFAFDPAAIALFEAGEESGKLMDILSALKAERSRFASLSSKVFAAMTYPAMILTLAFCMTTALIAFAVPQMAKTFVEMGVALPLPTRLLMHVSAFIRSPWFLAALLFMATFGRKLVVKFFKSAWLRRKWVRFPIVGDLARGIILLRCLRALGLLAGAGVPVARQFQIVSMVADHPEYQDYFSRVGERIMNGQKHYESFVKERHRIPVDGLYLASRMEMASYSGQIKDTLFDVTDSLDEKLSLKAEHLPKLIEPFLIIAIAMMIGTVILAMYMPTFILVREVLEGGVSGGA